uniref:Tp2 n=1 Tax=Mycobacterium leprae TaxID=1769 RepID=Q49710_MYCLR|nr:tp2 [Mycobacterium leprae]
MHRLPRDHFLPPAAVFTLGVRVCQYPGRCHPARVGSGVNGGAGSATTNTARSAMCKHKSRKLALPAVACSTILSAASSAFPALCGRRGRGSARSCRDRGVFVGMSRSHFDQRAFPSGTDHGK